MPRLGSLLPAEPTPPPAARRPSATCATAIMPLSGVRISWLMLARNIDLAAPSASASASSSAAVSAATLASCTRREGGRGGMERWQRARQRANAVQASSLKIPPGQGWLAAILCATASRRVCVCAVCRRPGGTCSSFSACRRRTSSVMSLCTPMKDSRRPEASRTGVMLHGGGRGGVQGG